MYSDLSEKLAAFPACEEWDKNTNTTCKKCVEAQFDWSVEP
jgi:hypothetical protein